MPDSSLKRLTCKNLTTGVSAPYEKDKTIPGRVLLLWVWPVLGKDTQGRRNIQSLIFRDGTVTGDILLQIPYQISGYAQAFNAHSLGEGGILFPNCLNVMFEDDDDTDQHFGGCTLLYQLG